MAERQIGLVFGAGHIGLMGVLADAILESGGEAIGVIPRSMKDKELAHTGLTDLRIVDTMHQRKALMAELSDGFAALPGGFGTGDEFFEILTWKQLGIHQKPIGVLNIHGYFDGMLTWMDHMIEEGFVRPQHRDLIVVEQEVDELLNRIINHTADKPASKWQ